MLNILLAIVAWWLSLWDLRADTSWATIPTMLASIAAASTNNRWVHSVAMAVIMLLWIWYFATLQGALN